MREGCRIPFRPIADRGRFGERARRSDGPIAAHGGRFPLRAGGVEAVEGMAEALPAVIEVPDLGAARARCASDDHRAIAALRRDAADTDRMIAEGVA